MENNEDLNDMVKSFMGNVVKRITAERPDLEKALQPVANMDFNNPEGLEEAMIEMDPSKKADIKAAFKDKNYLANVKAINNLIKTL